MVRTALPIIVPASPYPPAAGFAALALDFLFTAGDNVNNNKFAATGRELLIVQNTGGGAGTFTITSAPDERGRVGDITTYSVGVGLFSVWGPVPLLGWRQTDGQIYLTPSAATMKFAVIRLPAAV